MVTCPPFFARKKELGSSNGTHMARHYFTTNDIAKMCSVTRQTVINWIKSGRLKANLTPGGHRRVLREDLVRFFQENEMDPVVIAEFEDQSRKRVPYCWEYFSTGFTSRWWRHDCERCVVKEVRALRCYLLTRLLRFEREPCNTSCEECPYLRRYGQVLLEGGY